MTVWISRFDTAPQGRLRVAVKDAIDIAGTVTTAGCVAVRRAASPALADAACLAGIRADPGAVIVGKTGLTELCVSGYGDNEVFGTPVNPIVPEVIPGGSSSGSAVAVATGEADIGLGTDTGGSVRIPAACCGIVGLKTTWGRIPTAGVVPLAPSLDTVGPLARTVVDAVRGMRLLAPGFAPAGRPARTVGRLRVEGVDERTEEMVDAALEKAGLIVREVRLPGWEAAWGAFITIILGELWRSHHGLLDADGVGAYVNDGLHAGKGVTAARLEKAMGIRDDWRAEIEAALAEFGLLALPALPSPPPPIAGFAGFPITQLTAPFNLAGTPAIAMPVPSPGFAVPVSLQLVGPMDGEDLICATALAIEKSSPASRPDALRSRPAHR